MFISVDTEKAFDNIQHPFMIKALNKVGVERTYLNIIKAICDKHTTNIILSNKKLKAISKIGNKTRIPLLTTLIQHSIEILDRAIRQEKEIKGIQNGKEEVKRSLFANNMILYIQKSLKTPPKTY